MRYVLPVLPGPCCLEAWDYNVTVQVPVSLVEKNFHSYLKWPFKSDQRQTVHQDLLFYRNPHNLVMIVLKIVTNPGLA